MGFRDVEYCYVIIDFNNQIWKSMHATIKNRNLLNDDGINTGCIIGLVKILKFAYMKSKENLVIPKLVICEDRYPERKKNLYSKYQSVFKDYKKHIIYKDRPKKDFAYNPIEISRQFVDCIPHIKIWANGEEADDVIASFLNNHKNNKSILFSNDYDLCQLLSTYKKLKIYRSDDEENLKDSILKKFEGGSFNKIVLHKVIRGDSGDNVKSIFRYRFKETIQSYLRCDGSIEDYIKCVYEDFGKDSKHFNQLIENINLIKLNYKIVKLNEKIKYEKQIFDKINIKKWRRLCEVFQIPSLLNTPLIKLFSN